MRDRTSRLQTKPGATSRERSPNDILVSFLKAGATAAWSSDARSFRRPTRASWARPCSTTGPPREARRASAGPQNGAAWTRSESARKESACHERADSLQGSSLGRLAVLSALRRGRAVLARGARDRLHDRGLLPLRVEAVAPVHQVRNDERRHGRAGRRLSRRVRVRGEARQCHACHAFEWVGRPKAWQAWHVTHRFSREKRSSDG